MATKISDQNYTLNEFETRKILNTPIRKIKPTHAKHDYNLSKDERIKQARSILDTNK